MDLAMYRLPRPIALLLAIVPQAAGAAVSNTPPAPPASSGKPSAEAQAPTMSRGMLLYENHCLGCHESRLHLREHRSARDMNELRHWVAHWAVQQALTWDANDVRDVAQYLNLRYYHFPAEAPR